jgi:hypothetical protein
MACLAQRVVRMLPPKWQTSIEQESRDWVMRCPCGAETSVWEMGGIRYKACGHPLRAGRCGQCGLQFSGPIYRRGQATANASPVDGAAFQKPSTDSSFVLSSQPKQTAAAANSEHPSPIRIEDAVLWIDGVGCYRIITRESISIGCETESSRGADVRLMAGLSKRQATISRGADGDYLLTLDANGQGPQLIRNDEPFEIGANVKLRLRAPSSLSRTAVLEFASQHRPVQRLDGIILMEKVCILGPADDSHIRCSHWPSPVVLFRRGDELWCQATPGMKINGDAAAAQFALSQGAVLTADELRLRVEFSCG